MAIIIKRNIGQEPPETNDTTKRKKRRTKRRGCNTILQLLMPLVATRNQVWSLPLAIAQPLTDTIKMLPFAFDFLGFVGAGAVNWRSKKKKSGRRPPSCLTCYEEARYEIEWAQGALYSLAITGNAFEYSIPCLHILYSGCQFDISRKSDSSFLSQRGFTR